MKFPTPRNTEALHARADQTRLLCRIAALTSRSYLLTAELARRRGDFSAETEGVTQSKRTLALAKEYRQRSLKIETEATFGGQ